MSLERIINTEEPIPRRIFVGGLDMFIREEELCTLFENVGSVLAVNIVRSNPNCGNYGFVTFKDPAVANLLLSNYFNFYIRGRKIRISKAYLRQKSLSVCGVCPIQYY